MVAVDLSQGAIAGWHSTIFPPFFVAGALYSGFAPAVLPGLILRRWLRLGEFLHDPTFDKLGQALLEVGPPAEVFRNASPQRICQEIGRTARRETVFQYV